MNGQIRGRSPDRGNVVPEAVAALAQLDAMGARRPILLAYHPVARLNPYQALLYSRAWQHGIAPVPLFRLSELDDVRALARAAGVPLVLHLHWTSGVLWKVQTDEEARAAVDEFVAQLDRLRAGGGHVAWTVHNVLPHDAARPELEARLQQAIVDRATVLHVLSAETPTAAAEWFTIPPDKVVHVPHQSYQGAYLDVVSREEARWELGLAADEIVYAHLGAIKPYKGTERLLQAFDTILDRDRSRRRLVVAGGPDDDAATRALLDRCEMHPFVLLHARKIPADDMQLFLHAADLVVLPYARSLNSGVLMLALTFGVPVVAPAIGGIPELLEPEFGELFDPAEEGSLERAMLDADRLVTPSARDAARRAATRYDPRKLSSDFAQALSERIAAAEAVPA